MPLLGKENQRMMLDLASKDYRGQAEGFCLQASRADEFTEWTPDGHLRHSKFVGLGEDKEARDLVREG